MVSSEGRTDMIPLEQSIENLINVYHEADELLQNQINAVIQNDFDTLNELISKQIDHYNFLSNLESKFRVRLKHTANEVEVEGEGEELKLAGLLRYLPANDGKLATMRETLIREVNHVRSLSLQLINLIRFAQDFNVKTLRSMAVSAGQQNVHYDGKGHTNDGPLSTFSIDEKG